MRTLHMKKSLLIATIIGLTGLSQVASPQTKGDKEKIKLEQNKAIVRGYMAEVVNKGNLAAYDSYFSAEAVINSRPLKQQLPAAMQAIRGAFPDSRVTIEDQIAEGDKVVTRVTFTGTHQGEFMGIAATGKQVKYSGIAIDRIVDGKVVEMWHVAETLGLLQQIGARLSPEPKK
jgi:steroid delta-isomerase-like uncharacterized protein